MLYLMEKIQFSFQCGAPTIYPCFQTVVNVFKDWAFHLFPEGTVVCLSGVITLTHSCFLVLFSLWFKTLLSCHGHSDKGTEGKKMKKNPINICVESAMFNRKFSNRILFIKEIVVLKISVCWYNYKSDHCRVFLRL